MLGSLLTHTVFVSCELCKDIIEYPDRPHVIRSCAGCGRDLHLVETTSDGKGLHVRAGDRISIPSGWLRISLNPLTGIGHLFRPGVDMLAQTFFVDSLPTKEELFADVYSELERKTDDLVNNFAPLVGLDVNNHLHVDRIEAVMEDHSRTAEFWAMWTGRFLALASGACQ